MGRQEKNVDTKVNRLGGKRLVSVAYRLPSRASGAAALTMIVSLESEVLALKPD